MNSFSNTLSSKTSSANFKTDKKKIHAFAQTCVLIYEDFTHSPFQAFEALRSKVEVQKRQFIFFYASSEHGTLKIFFKVSTFLFIRSCKIFRIFGRSPSFKDRIQKENFSIFLNVLMEPKDIYDHKSILTKKMTQNSFVEIYNELCKNAKVINLESINAFTDQLYHSVIKNNLESEDGQDVGEFGEIEFRSKMNKKLKSEEGQNVGEFEKINLRSKMTNKLKFEEGLYAGEFGEVKFGSENIKAPANKKLNFEERLCGGEFGELVCMSKNKKQFGNQTKQENLGLKIEECAKKSNNEAEAIVEYIKKACYNAAEHYVSTLSLKIKEVAEKLETSALFENL